MKFIAAALFAAGAQAQVASLTSVLTAVQSGTNKLDSGIKSFSGAGDAITLEGTASDLISTISNANKVVSGLSALSGGDALALVGPGTQLAAAVHAAVTDAVAKKSAFVAASVADLVKMEIASISSGGVALGSGVLSLVPASLQPIASSIITPIFNDLSSLSAAYATISGGGGSSGSASASASASASGSSSAASSAPVYPTGSSSTGVAPTGTGSAPATSSTLPPFNPNGASSNAASFGAAVMVALGVAAAF